MPHVESDGARIYYESVGTGPSVVLHTGAGGDSRIWRDAGYLDGLGKFHVVLIDQRGRGRSDRPREIEAHRLDRFVGDVTAVLDELDIRRTAFWGYSSGSLVGVAFAGVHPERLRCLVGIGAMRYRNLSELPPVDAAAEIAEDVAKEGVVAELEDRMRDEHDRFPDPIDRNVREGDPLMHALDGVAWRSWHGPAAVLDRFPAPLLMLTGEIEDPNRATEAMVAKVPGARIVRVPGVGHLGAFYRSDLTLPVAVPFLEQHTR